MLVPPDMTPVLDYNRRLGQAQQFRLLDVVGPQCVLIILGRNWLAVQSQHSQLLDVAVLVASLVLDHNLSALDTPAVEAAKVHCTAPAGQVDITLVSTSDSGLLDIGEVLVLLDALAQIVDLAEDTLAPRVVPSLPLSFPVPIHIVVAGAAGCSEIPHTAVGSAETLKEDSWRAMSRPHLVQAPVCDVSSAGLDEN